MPIDPRDAIALDAASPNRVFDKDGHLHVQDSAISRAAVNGYLGREIPEAESLGLLPDRLYQLFRDPAELERAAPSFQGKPLMIIHKPQVASDHDRSIVVGAVRDPRWVAPFMRATLDVWDGEAIAGIETEQQCQLSSGYRYKAVMTPGEYDGVPYDGVMTEIVCNHVTLVENGRAGDEVIVGDSAISLTTPEENAAMAHPALSRSALLASGALRAYLIPKLAADAKLDVAPMFAGVTKKTWKADKPKLKVALDKALPKGSPLLAKDADIEDVVQMLDQLDDVVDAVEEEPVKVVPAADEEDPDAETEEERKERLAKRAAAKNGDQAITKPAMDAAIATAVTKAVADAETATVARMRALGDAERFVRPWVGDIVIAQDSAAGVFKLALDALGVEVASISGSTRMTDAEKADAYKAILTVQPRPGADDTSGGGRRLGLDTASEEAKFRAKYPTASKLIRS